MSRSAAYSIPAVTRCRNAMLWQASGGSEACRYLHHAPEGIVGHASRRRSLGVPDGSDLRRTGEVALHERRFLCARHLAQLRRRIRRWLGVERGSWHCWSQG